jgi:hypothetical protein
MYLFKSIFYADLALVMLLMPKDEVVWKANFAKEKDQ